MALCLALLPQAWQFLRFEQNLKENKMNVDVIMKVAGVGMIVAVVCQILNKAGRDEQATLVSITGIVIILLLVIQEIGTLLDSLKKVFGL